MALRRLSTALTTELAARTPLAAEHRVVDGLSRLAEGKSADNRLRMSLSAYVLAARLEQVALSASERLFRMSSGRYSLLPLGRGRERPLAWRAGAAGPRRVDRSGARPRHALRWRELLGLARARARARRRGDLRGRRGPARDPLRRRGLRLARRRDPRRGDGCPRRPARGRPDGGRREPRGRPAPAHPDPAAGGQDPPRLGSCASSPRPDHCRDRPITPGRPAPHPAMHPGRPDGGSSTNPPAGRAEDRVDGPTGTRHGPVQQINTTGAVRATTGGGWSK